MNAPRKAAASLLLMVMLLSGLFVQSCTSDSPEIEVAYPVDRPVARLLLDQVHRTPALPGAGLTKQDFSYFGVGNWDRQLRHLQSLGVSGEILRKGTLNRKLLRQYQLFYLDLPTEGGRVFGPGELDDLEWWVREGGGLLAVAEHSNAYHSAERIRPFLSRFGIEVQNTTAVDAENVFAFGAWHKLRRIAAHPTTRGIRAVAVTTGTALHLSVGHEAQPVPLMLTSDNTFQDHWDPAAPGFIGDLKRQEDELVGACVQVAAATPGKGRMVMVGDRNLTGNILLNYVDNAAFLLQVWRWLSRDRIGIPARTYPYDGREQGLSILIPETVQPSDVMTPHSFREGYCTRSWYTLFATLNRDLEVIARCSEWLEGSYDVIMLPPQPHRFSSALVDYLRQSLEGGAALVLIVNPKEGVSQGTSQVLAGLGEDEVVQALQQCLEGQQSIRESVRVEVAQREVGEGQLLYYPLRFPAGRPVIQIVTDRGVVPVLVRLPERRIYFFLQGQMIRNDAFQTRSGTLLGTGPLKPDADGMLVFRMLWAWLDEMKPGGTESLDARPSPPSRPGL